MNYFKDSSGDVWISAKSRSKIDELSYMLHKLSLISIYDFIDIKNTAIRYSLYKLFHKNKVIKTETNTD